MILDDLSARYDRIDTNRLITLTNGFDEEDFAGIERIDPPKLTLVHTGSLFASRDPKALRIALADLCRDEKGFADGVEVVIAGRIDPDVKEAFRSPPLDRIVALPGYLEHERSLRLLRRAHFCLLFVGQEKSVHGMLTGKLFEYLGSGTPVLAVAPEGEAKELIERCGAGIVVDPSDTERAREVMRTIWRDFRAGKRHFAEPDETHIAGYGRRALTGRLAEILDDVTGLGLS
jgi:glycosyltransferase involved in cell wall biosynthesis